MKERMITILKHFIICLSLILSFSLQSANGQGEITKSTIINPKSSRPPKPPKPNNSDKGQKSSSRKKDSVNKPYKPSKPVTASLEITVNEGGSSIEINLLEKNGATYAQSTTGADSGDALLFESLKPGDYLVKVRKNGFYEQQLKVTLRAGETAAVNALLKPSTGFLTVVSNIDDAEIEIKNFGSFTGRIDNLDVPPKQYEVLISAEGYEPVSRIVDVRLGQEAIVEGNLKLIAAEKLLQSAERDYQNGLYKETISNCRLVLEQNSDDPQANLLMGYAYFYTNRPRESRFYLARALALQKEAEIPIKIYQKEKNSETLTDGMLKINQNNLSFYSAKRPDLSFSISPSSIGRLEINQEKNNSGRNSSTKPDAIEIKASVSNGKKTEKKNLRLFPRQAFARVVTQNKAEIAACAGCKDGSCLCRTEIGAVYELLLNWKSGSYPRRTDNFLAVVTPSMSFTQVDGQNFSLKIPDNWLKISQTDASTWFAPNGGFSRSQNLIQYVYAVNIGVLPINVNDLRLESERLYQSNLSANGYLQQHTEPREIIISGRKGLVAGFAGFNAESGEEEFIQIYTAFNKEGNLFYVMTVIPFEKRQEYRRIFRSIINSINLYFD